MTASSTRPGARTAVALSILLICGGLAGPGWAQADAIKRTILQRRDVAGENKEMVMAIVDIPPHSDSPRQIHPGEEFVYLLAGDLTVRIDGQSPLTLQPGGSFTVARGAKHNTSTAGGAKLLVTWTVDKGAPLATNVD